MSTPDELKPALYLLPPGVEPRLRVQGTKMAAGQYIYAATVHGEQLPVMITGNPRRKLSREAWARSRRNTIKRGREREAEAIKSNGRTGAMLSRRPSGLIEGG